MVENKILIAIPCVDTIPVYNIECLLNLIKPCECNIRFGVNSGLVYIARDEACSIAINGGYTHVLFVDSDMAYEQKALEKALAHDDDVVTGLYFRRKGNHEPVLYRAIDQRRYDENGKIKYHGFAEVETDIERDYFPVAGCGFGFLLVKTDVLKRMQKEVNISWFEPIPGMGEDLSFCQRLKEIDVKVMCDTTIKLGHYGLYGYTKEDWIPEENDGIKIEWNKQTEN